MILDDRTSGPIKSSDLKQLHAEKDLSYNRVYFKLIPTPAL